MNQPLLHSIAATLITLSASAAAQHAAAGPHEGAFRLGLESTLLAHEEISTTLDFGGFEAETSRSETTLGISQIAGLGPLIGYAVSDRIVLSGRVSLATREVASDEGEAISQTRISLLPGVEYLLAWSGSSLVPYLGGVLGVLIGSTPVGGSEMSEVALGLGLQGGLHYFFADGISFDPTLLLMYRVGGGSIGGGLEPVTASIRGFGVLLAVGLSTWQ